VKIIALNKSVQRFVKKTENKAFSLKIDRNLPLIESLFAGTVYCGAIYLQNNIPKERKPSLMFQTIIGTIAGISISKYLDNLINRHKENLCNELKTRKLPNIDNIIKGTRIMTPLIITTLVTRYAIPVATVPISSWLNKVRKNKNENKRKNI